MIEKVFDIVNKKRKPKRIFEVCVYYKGIFRMSVSVEESWYPIIESKALPLSVDRWTAEMLTKNLFLRQAGCEFFIEEFALTQLT